MQMKNYEGSLYKKYPGRYRMFGSACICKNKIWYTSLRYNALFSIDLDTEKLEYHGSIDGEPLDEINLFDNIFCVEGKLILTPWRSCFCEYDINSKKIFKYAVPETDKNSGYIGSILIDKYIFFIQQHPVKRVLKYSLCDKTIEVIRELDSMLSKILPEVYVYMCAANGKLFIACSELNKLYMYDFQNDESREIYLDLNCDYYNVVSVEKGIFAIGWKQPRAVYYNPVTGENQVFEIDKKYHWDDNLQFCCLQYWNSKVYCIPYFTNYCIVFDLKNNTMTYRDIYKENGIRHLNQLLPVNDHLMVMLPFIFDKKLYCSDGREIVLDDEEILKDVFRKSLSEREVYEHEEFDLKLYLDVLN